MNDQVTPPATPPEQPVANASPAKSYPPVSMKGEIKIFPDRRKAQYDQGVIKAYEAVGAGGVKGFALVCEKNIVPQSEIVHKYAGIVTAHLPKLIACGVVDWSVDFKEHFVFVYEDKMGNPIAARRNPAALALKADLVISTIFRNMLDVLRAMRDKGIAHGNIHVGNIFDGESPTFENAMLGEMLSTPSGYCQPVIYQTIDRALSNPLGRGSAEISDDVYALGVTLAALLRNSDPAEGMKDEEIITAKMEMGSFNFVVGKSRFPAPILEFLRGTLNDDPDLRWTFDDIMVWAEGRRVTIKQSSGPVTLKASRPIDFAFKKYLKPQLLGDALPKDAALCVNLVEKGELYLWLNRSLQDKEMEERYESALTEAKKDAGGSNYADRLACMMAVALAPESPIYYRTLRFTPAGFGNLLVDAVCSKKDLGPYVDVMQSSIVSFWHKCSFNQTAGVGDAVNRIGNCYRFISQTLIGYGLERCIYYLSPMAPCLSEKLDNFYVRSAEDYVLAMEKLANSKGRPEWFLDRHIVAFLCIRDRSAIEPFLADIGAPDKHRQRHGVLKMLAFIQRRDKLEALPGLSNWISGMLDVLINRYHDRERRRVLKEQLEKLKGQGSLEKIASLFENFEDIQTDMRNYTEVMKQYQALKKEYSVLEHELNTNSKFGLDMGKQVAALASGTIAGIVVAIYLIFSISGGGGKIF